MAPSCSKNFFYHIFFLNSFLWLVILCIACHFALFVNFFCLILMRFRFIYIKKLTILTSVIHKSLISTERILSSFMFTTHLVLISKCSPHPVSMPFALWLCHFSYEEKESASLLSQPGLVCDLLWPMECSRTTPEPVPSLGTAYIFSWKSSSLVWPSTVNLVEDEKPCGREPVHTWVTGQPRSQNRITCPPSAYCRCIRELDQDQKNSQLSPA